MKPLCIYHANCADGFGAAWVVRKFYNNEVDFHPGVFYDTPPDVVGRDVIIVDFSYPRAIFEQMVREAKSILIIDHHKSAMLDLKGIELLSNVTANFDLSKSGVVLTWEWYFPNVEIPKLLLHIQDQDIHKFLLDNTREINLGLFSYPYSFELWDSFVNDPKALEQLNIDGIPIRRNNVKQIRNLVAITQREMVIGGIRMPVANLPNIMTGDACHVMMAASLHESKVAACYIDSKDLRIFSLRSTKDGPDVSVIASQYGGGGHANASGFSILISELSDDMR